MAAPCRPSRTSGGHLVALPRSTRGLSGTPADAAQVAISPDGRQLVVTGKATSLTDVYSLDVFGYASRRTAVASSGSTGRLAVAARRRRRAPHPGRRASPLAEGPQGRVGRSASPWGAARRFVRRPVSRQPRSRGRGPARAAGSAGSPATTAGRPGARTAGPTTGRSDVSIFGLRWARGLRHQLLLRPGLPLRLDDQQVGPAGAGAARLHRRLAVHLAAADQRRGRLRRALPTRVRSRTHRRAAAAAGGRPGPRRARSRGHGPLYAAFGARIFDTAADPAVDRSEGEVRERRGTREFVEPILAEAGLPLALADALDDDVVGRRDPAGDRRGALADRQGRRHARSSTSSRRPASRSSAGDQPAARPRTRRPSCGTTWSGWRGFPGFAELKRSLREQPQLLALGVDAETVGRQEDWHGGSRRQKK